MTSIRNRGLGFPLEIVRSDLIKSREIKGFSIGNIKSVSSGKFVIHNIKQKIK